MELASYMFTSRLPGWLGTLAFLISTPTGFSQSPTPVSQPLRPILYQSFHVNGGDFTVHLAVFDPKQYQLRVIDNGPQFDLPTYRSLADAMKRKGCVAGINGGFFDMHNFKPCGLMVSEGNTFSKFDPKGWQEGVLVVRDREVAPVERDAYVKPDGLLAGLQSSPWLVRGGRIEEIQKRDDRSARRAFVIKGKSGLCAIGFSTYVTFYALADFLLSDPVSKLIEPSEVLALDGATSAGFWCNIGGTEVSDPERTTVRNFVGISPIR